jgi:hypothetical protein
MKIGKIVKSDSHINYVCQIYGPNERMEKPGPADYAFGRFVRVALRSNEYDGVHAITHDEKEPVTYAVGVIYDTILQNPAFGSLGPRLSNEAQVELFSPDYISEKAILTYVMLLGMIEQRNDSNGNVVEYISAIHGVPSLSLELDCDIETMNDVDVQAFHYFNDAANVGDVSRPHSPDAYLHIGYLPHIIAQRSSLLPMVTLCIIDQLERLFPQNLALLSIVKRNFAWRLKVETAG